MSLEPPPSLATYDPRRSGRLHAAKWVLLSAAAAWLWDRPTEPSAVIVAVVVGGGAFWFGLGPGWANFKFHSNLAVRMAAWVTSLALMLFTMKKIVPFLQAYAAAV